MERAGLRGVCWVLPAHVIFVETQSASVSRALAQPFHYRLLRTSPRTTSVTVVAVSTCSRLLLATFSGLPTAVPRNCPGAV